MSSKIEFVEEAVQDGANISALCRKHGISRQSAYKYLERFREHGYAGLEEESRRPKSAPYATAEEVVVAVLEARAKHPGWGATKLLVVLRRTLGKDVPSERTINRILDRFGQLRARRKKRRLSVIESAPSVLARHPNDVWTIDFKGWWRTADGSRCEPLTIRDAYSRYVLAIELLSKTTGELVRKVMERLFRRYGVPKAIQCDNGSPFISTRALGGLTKLSAWWVSLGIKLIRSRPGCPQDNGGHERMHRDMAADLQAAPASSVVQQQHSCERWRQTFNHIRPHGALSNKTPGEVYKPKRSTKRRSTSMRTMQVCIPTYPSSWLRRVVSKCGEICVDGDRSFISTALGGHQIALEPVGGVRFRVWFYDLALGEIELALVTDEQVERLAS